MADSRPLRRAARDDRRRRRYNSRLPTTSTDHRRSRRTGPTDHTGPPSTARSALPGRARSIATGRSFVTEPRQTGADVRSLTDALIAHAQQRRWSAHVGGGGQRTVEAAEVTPAQAKKMLRASPRPASPSWSTTRRNGRRRVAAARSATPASKATTAKATRQEAAGATPKQDAGRRRRRRPKPRRARPRRARRQGRRRRRPAAEPAAGEGAAKAARQGRQGGRRGAPGAGAKADGTPTAEARGRRAATETRARGARRRDRGRRRRGAGRAGPGRRGRRRRATDDDFEWDDEESEALKQARRDAELTASADSVRAYLKQIGKVPLLNAEQEVELAKRIEAGLYAAERLRAAEEGEREARHARCAATWTGSPATASGPRTTCWRPTCGSWSRWPSATPAAAWPSST